MAEVEDQLALRDQTVKAQAVKLGEALGEAEFATKAAEDARAQSRRDMERLHGMVVNAEQRAEVRIAMLSCVNE